MQGSTKKMLEHLSTDQQAQLASSPDVKAAAGAAPIAKEKGWLSPPADEEVGKNLSPTASSGTSLAATALPIAAASNQQVQLTNILDAKVTAVTAPIANEKRWPTPPPDKEVGEDLSPTSSDKPSAAASIAANAAGKIDSKTDAKYEMFSYKNITSKFQISADMAFTSNAVDPIFAKLSDTLPRSGEENGWKFHIALSEEKGNVAKGWNAIKDILFEYRVSLTKVVKPNIKLAEAAPDGQAGKQITIYSFANPNLPWETILNKIENKLMVAGVTTGKFSPGDKPVAGSRYFSYRNDHFLEGGYLQAFKAAEINPKVPFNPYLEDDPYKNIRIQQAPVQSATAETTAAGGSATATTTMTTASVGLSFQR